MSPLNSLLRLLAPYEKFDRTPDGSLAERKHNLETALQNCRSTIDTATGQLTILKDRMLLDDLMRMRADAIAAVPLAENALAALEEDSFTVWREEFEEKYDRLVSDVRAFAWDSGPGQARALFSLVEEIM